MNVLRMILLTAAATALLVTPAGAIYYVSDLTGSFEFTYDADINGYFPDLETNGDFMLGTMSYTAELEFPQPEEGIFDWYVMPDAYISGVVHPQELLIEFIINDQGMFIYADGHLSKDKYWGEFGYTWIPGRGLLIDSMETPAQAHPADPDRILGFWDHDLDADGIQDVIADITGSSGEHDVMLSVTRSLWWMGDHGELVVNNFADWLETKIASLPTDLIRDQDISPLRDMDSFIMAFGGPVVGVDFEGSGTYSVTVRCFPQTAIEQTTWSEVKSLF